VVGTVSTTSTGDPNLQDKLISAVTDTSISVLGTAIGYSIHSPFFPPYFPPFFPPNFCAGCAPAPWPDNCTRIYPNTCDGTMTYQYFDCGGCQTCPGTGGYNGAYIDGSCGYTAPPAGGGGGGGTPPPPPIPPPAPGACDACGGGGGYGCVDLKGNGEFGCL